MRTYLSYGSNKRPPLLAPALDRTHKFCPTHAKIDEHPANIQCRSDLWPSVRQHRSKFHLRRSSRTILADFEATLGSSEAKSRVGLRYSATLWAEVVQVAKRRLRLRDSPKMARIRKARGDVGPRFATLGLCHEHRYGPPSGAAQSFACVSQLQGVLKTPYLRQRSSACLRRAGAPSWRAAALMARIDAISKSHK